MRGDDIINKPRFHDKSKIKNISIYDLQLGEIFLDVTSSEVSDVYDYYQISNYGRVWHKYMGIFLKPSFNGGGYLYVMLSTYNGPKPIQIHRLEMIKFKPIYNYQNLDVNHKDGIKYHNKLNNLEWMTRQENIIHAYNNGLAKKNENSCKTNLINEEVRNICILLSENKYSNKEISKITNVNERIISDIKQRTSWSNISSEYNFNIRPGKLFTEQMVMNLCLYFQNNNINNLTINQFCRNTLSFYGYDCSDNMIDSARKIYTRKYYTKISSNYLF